MMGEVPPMETAPTLTATECRRGLMPPLYKGGRRRGRARFGYTSFDYFAGQTIRVTARIIYSTGIGSLCPNCRRPVRECVCPKGAPAKPKPSAIRVGRETQGRAGKGVTTVTGLPLAVADIETLAAKLKKRCGSGGTVRNGIIEIQGEHRDAIVAELVKMGWQAKRSGG
jgi:translation initiation factor 1